MLDVKALPILKDNYTFIIQSNDKVGLIDVGDAQPIIEYLTEYGLNPDFLFTTHHHWDHIDGIEEIKERYNPHHIAPEKDQARIPQIDQGVVEGDKINFGSEIIQVIETPGHTKNHVVFYCQNSKILFSTDTLFAMGCGRLFEGTAEDMFTSFQKLKVLPNETIIYFGHEYTLAHAEFCHSVLPHNKEIKVRHNKIKALQEAGKPTIPTTLALEKGTNIFMMAESAEEFKKYRDLKDKF